MKTTKKEEQGSQAVKVENAIPAFKKPHVNEQARLEMMDKYKYGDKYRD